MLNRSVANLHPQARQPLKFYNAHQSTFSFPDFSKCLEIFVPFYFNFNFENELILQMRATFNIHQGSPMTVWFAINNKVVKCCVRVDIYFRYCVFICCEMRGWYRDNSRMLILSVSCKCVAVQTVCLLLRCCYLCKVQFSYLLDTRYLCVDTRNIIKWIYQKCVDARCGG